MIQLSSAGKRYGHKLLFEGVDWLITPKDRIGLVGANGTGKSTLLKVLGRLETLDYGSISIAKGISAGYLLGVYHLGIDPTYLWHNMLKYTTSSEVFVGLIKSFVFGGLVAMIGCYKGMSCGEGAEGVGRATTEAVVYSSISILISNFFLTLTLGQIFHSF